MAVYNFIPTKNVSIASGYPSNNFQGSISVFTGWYTGSSDIYRTLLYFDISSIPQFSTITNASLNLYLYRNDTPTTAKPTGVYRLLSNFNESSVNYINKPANLPTPEASIIVNAELNTYLTWDITDLVKGWYDNSIPNNGITVIGIESETGLLGFRSKEYNDSRYWPYLQIKYISGTMTTNTVENVTTTDTFTGSTAIEIGSNGASFGIVNTGANPALVKLQLSEDGITWFDDTSSVTADLNLAAGGSAVLNTTGTMKYARVLYKSVSALLPTTLTIQPVTKG